MNHATQAHRRTSAIPAWGRVAVGTNGASRGAVRRLLAGLTSAVLIASGLVFAATTPAVAEQSPLPTTIRSANTFFAYVGPGENLDVSFRFAEAASPAGAGSTTITLRGPGGIVQTCTRPAVEVVNGACSFQNRTSATPGVWQIDFQPDGTSSTQLNRYEWDINVQTGTTNIPGRVYSENYRMTQRGDQTTDFALFYVSEQGFRYRADYEGYNGVDSIFRSDATGVAEIGTCVSAYESMDRGGPDSDTARLWQPPSGQCGDPFKIFFRAPAASLPATATLWDGSTVWLRPEVVLPEISALTFTRDSAITSAGTFSFDTANFAGQLDVLVDANNDGDYSDPEDRRIPAAVTQDGTTTVAFDGLDGLGNPIPSGVPMGARAEITQAGEIHFSNNDVETRTSLSVRALNGPQAGSTTLYWDDSDLDVGARDCTTPRVDGTAGVDSSGGVHGWTCPDISEANENDGVNGGWGDFRVIDDWTYQTVDASVEIEISAASLDFGDAPDGYGTTMGANGAHHGVVPGLMLGAALDGEADGQPSVAADGDGADEDGVVFNPALGYPSPTLRTGVDPVSQQPLSNTLAVEASAPGFVSVWVDWNLDGDFLDADEDVANAQAVAPGSNDVTFSQGTNPAGTQTYVRVRYSTDAAALTSPTGAAPDGEVEDYRVLVDRRIQPDSCAPSDTDYYAFTFDQPVNLTGTGGVGSTARYENVTVINGVAVDMFAQVIAGAMRADQGPPNGFLGGTNGTLGDDDAQWQINTDATLRYSFYEAGTTTPVAISGVFNVSDLDTNESGTFNDADLASYAITQGSAVTIVESAGTVRFNGNGAWSGDPESRFQIVLEGISTFDARWRGGNGSGFGFDGDGDLGIQPPACQDYGDAPDSYGTTIAANGASHTIIAGLTIGSSIDFDSDGQPSMLADGDDANRTGDEDGAADPIVVTVGDQTTVVITATNTTARDAFLTGWIDLDGNGWFDPGELNNGTVTVPANSGTASYTLVFPAGTVTTDTFARFRLAPPQGDIIMVDPVGHLHGGEVEDYPVTVVERELVVTKVSDASVDSRPGDVVTYTVTATNTGSADYTDAFPAVVADDLSGVLDDASYNGDAVASVGAAPSFVSPLLSWRGALPAGESVSITYTVTLVAGGDGVVRNVAFVPPCDPADAGCDPVTPECDPPVGGVDPVTGEPCVVVETLLPRLSHSKVADTTELPADGGVVTYTVTVTNEGPGVFTVAEPGEFSDDLSNVLDDAVYSGDASATSGSVTFDAAGESLSWSGALGVGESATVTYSVTYDDATGDNVLLNVACVPVGLAADPTDPCRSVQIPGSALQDRKSSDPVSGSSVVSGQQVTYTLFFENTGEAPATVDTFDEMAATLDDAVLTAGPTVSDPGLTATVNGTRIDITGSVPVGATYTVSYTVTVNAFEAQGDHVLGNVLGECLAFDPTCRTEHPVRHVTVTKVSDPATGVETGDTVTYTVTVTNDGEAEYTADAPARAEDDLTGVLDDAVYNGDVVASAGTVSYAEPLISWSGPLAVGASASFTYTVTVSNAGDHVLENVAGPVCAAPEICGPPVVVIIPLPHVVPSKVSDPASGSDVAAGDVVTYTLSWVNEGEAAGRVDSTDDLSGVLDDADVTAEPVSSDAAVTVVRTGDEIRVTGPIQPDQTITVTYQVTIGADGDRGDNIAGNVLTPDVPVCLDEAACPPPVTEHFIGELDDWKTVDPVFGSTVQAGQEVTYTLHFENTGEAPVEVDRDDVLTQVLDDATITAAPVSSDPVLSVSAVDGDRFTVTGTLAVGQLVTVSYTVMVNPDGQRGDDRLGNFLVDPGVEPPVECVPEDPLRPDCTVNHVSNVVASKSSDPGSGARLLPGQQVTYTLTFVNVSTNPDAADGPVEYTDYLVDVLDDAAITAGLVVSDAAVTAVMDGNTIQITGAIASGETVTVTYTVTVNPYDRQGDHHLGNVLAVTGQDPVCAEGSRLCTSHPLLPPPALAVTGATIAWSVVATALLLLLAGGGIILINRRRKEATSNH